MIAKVFYILPSQELFPWIARVLYFHRYTVQKNYIMTTLMQVSCNLEKEND